MQGTYISQCIGYVANSLSPNPFCEQAQRIERKAFAYMMIIHDKQNKKDERQSEFVLGLV